MTDSDKGLDDLLEDDAYALPSSQPANATDLVTLNVGGSIFCTSKSTLFKYPGSYFSARFNGIYSSDTDDKGRHFIDRDGNRFRHILNYLRSGNCILGTDRRLCEELIEEAQYYGLQQLEENLLVRLSGLILEGHEKESELSSTSKATIDRRKEMAFDSPRCARSARKRNESPRAARVRRLDFEFSEDTTKNRVHDRIEPRRILPRAAPMWEFTTSEDF